MPKSPLPTKRSAQGIPCRAILFDFDGVLARTMEDNCAAWEAAFAEHGVRMAPEEFYPLEGAGMRQVATTIGARHGLAESLVPQIMATKDEHYFSHNRFQFYPGVKDFLANLSRHGLSLALVTGCSGKRLSQTASESFLALFQAVIHGDSGGKNKPSPEPYQKAMSALGVAASDCIVVENAPLGILSAKEAGAYCLAIETTLPAKFLGSADEIVRSHAQLFQRLGALTGGSAANSRPPWR